MKRSELIEVIDQLRSDSIDDGERAMLLGIIHFQSAVGHMARISLRAMLGRALRCAMLFVCRFGFLSKEDIQRFRQAERGLAVVIVFVSLFTLFSLSFKLLLPLIVKVAEYFDVNGIVFTLLPFVIGLIIYILIFRMLPRHDPRELGQELRFRDWCVGCGYELKGLESALGDELWVGPAVCPECGQDYPAVGI